MKTKSGHIQKIKRKTGTAHKCYWYENGQHKTKTFPPNIPKEFVLDWLNRKTTEIAYQKYNPNPQPQFNNTSLQQLQYIYNQKRANEIDIERANYALLSIMHYISPGININSITHQTINTYRDQLLIDRMNKFTKRFGQPPYAREQKIRRGVNKELYNLRVIFNWAYKNDLMQNKIFDKVTMLKASRPKPDVLTRTEERAFRRNLPKTDIRLVYYIMKFTGMRRGEVLSIRRKYIDMANQCITLPKTKNRDETIKIILPQLYKLFKTINITNGNPDEPIFTYSKYTVSDAFRKALNKAGLSHKRNPSHIHRHTFGFRIIESYSDDLDKGERLAQEMLDHKTKQMTKHYTQIHKEKLRNPMNKVKF